MTFLSVMQNLATNASVAIPTTAGQNDADSTKFREFINEAGKEIARRVDWSALRKTATLTGTGASIPHTIADDYDRLARGLNVVADGQPVRGSLTQDEWFGLDPVEGTPRYFYLANSQMAFWPYLANAETARVQYQSKNWVSGDKDEMTTDNDTALFDENLLLLGALWRWRRHVAKDFADNMAEFEAALADRASFDGGVRQP